MMLFEMTHHLFGRRKIPFMILVFLLLLLSSPLWAAEVDLTRLSIEELMKVKVTSVSKKSQTLSDSAAAIFVITNEDLKRSGVTNIPDALRMVPGVNVARIDANKWAINSRGFNGRFSAQLLVLVDGRSVYSPMFSGVYWEVNDMMLEDVDRIEVIRGPGATLWGANAVNGVINIISKKAQETQGGIVTAGTGNVEKAMAAARYGAALGEDTHWRIYAKHNDRDSFSYPSGKDANDDWDMQRTGFRMDSRLTSRDNLTFQGDLFQADISQDLYLVNRDPFPHMAIFPVDTPVSGGNLLSRWSRTLSATSDFSFQIYYDAGNRKEDIISEERDTFDLDFQHHFDLGTRHDIVWGARYNHTQDEFINSPISDMNPLSRQDELFSAFVQDEIAFWDNQVHLTLGSKFEHNDYTGVEIQPSARLMWAVNSENKVWGAVSRAVRTPSRAETDAEFSYLADPQPVPSPPFPSPMVPLVINVTGTENFESEELMAYELGYRFIPAQKFSLDLAFFYNEYDKIRNFEPLASRFTGTSIEQDLIFANTSEETTYGGELALAYQVSEFFKCDLAYGFNLADRGETGGFPKHQVSARGQFNLTQDLELDLWLRYMDNISAAYILNENRQYEIDDYLTMDVRLGWRITPQIELSLVGQNLLESTRVEYVQESFSLPVEIDRSIFAKLTYRF